MSLGSKSFSSDRRSTGPNSSGDSQEDMHMDSLKMHNNERSETPTPKTRISTGVGSRSNGARNSKRMSNHRNPSHRAPHTTRSASIPRTHGPQGALSQHPQHPTAGHYTRPVGPEIVSANQPSCSGLPHSWNSIHDRFIAYLATHAPLTKDGKIPAREELKERWKTADIAKILRERFPRLSKYKIKVSAVEKRLELLDAAGDNDYFKIPYGAYKFEEWGRGI